MIDLTRESALTLNEIRRLPFLRGRGGNAISLCTLRRWCTRGVAGVVLETARIGGTVVTTAEAAMRLVERLSSSERRVSVHSIAHRRREIAAAEKRLDDAGI